MSHQATKQALKEVLDDPACKVVVVSGRWGNGKTHLWRSVRDDHKANKIKQALYASLFGVTELSHLKLKLVQKILEGDQEHGTLGQRLRKSGAALLEETRKAIPAIFRGASVLDQIALMSAPTLLKDKVIVLDDIERMHDKFSIKELMGFIDEFKNECGAEFVVILNDDELPKSQLEDWNRWKEKIVDQEVRVRTSPSEAFAIASSNTPLPDAAVNIARSAIEASEISNIRTLQRINRIIRLILGSCQPASPAVLSRIIPSTVILTAAHFHGSHNNVSVDCVLASGSKDDPRISRGESAPDTESTPYARANWALLTRLGISIAAEYEHLLVDYLRSGQLDRVELRTQIERYIGEDGAAEAIREAQALAKWLRWEYRASRNEIENRITAFMPQVRFLVPLEASKLAEIVSERLPDDTSLATSIAESWLAAYREGKWPRPRQFGRSGMHPLLLEEFERDDAAENISPTFVEVCLNHNVHATNNRSSFDSILKQTTASEFEKQIRILETERLEPFLACMLKLTGNTEMSVRRFGRAIPNFVEACRTIVDDASTP